MMRPPEQPPASPAQRRVLYLKSLRKLAASPLMNKPEQPDATFALYADLLQERDAPPAAVDRAINSYLGRSKYFPTPAELFEALDGVERVEDARRRAAEPTMQHDEDFINDLNPGLRRFIELGDAWFPEQYASFEEYERFNDLISELSLLYTTRYYSFPADDAGQTYARRDPNAPDRSDFIFQHPRYAALCKEVGRDPNGRVEAGTVLAFTPAAGIPAQHAPRTPAPELDAELSADDDGL